MGFLEAHHTYRSDMYKLAGIEIFYWIAIAVGGYLTVLMQNKGMSASTIGIVNAINSGVVIFSVPFWGIVGDKMQSMKKVFLLTIILSTVLFPTIAGATYLPYGLVLMSVMVVITYFFRTPAQNLMESWVIQHSNVRKLNYGPIRAMGSIAYAIVGIIISFILPHIGVECTFYVYPLFMLPTILIGFSLKEVREGTSKAKLKLKDMHLGSLFKDYRYLTFIIFVFLYSIASYSEFTFMPYLLENAGIDGSRFGVIYGYRAFLEAPALFAVAFLRKKIPLRYLVIIGVISYAVELFLMASSTTLMQMVLSSTVSGIGSGLLIGTAMSYCFTLAPDHLKATAMTTYGAMGSMSGIVGNLCGGFILENYGAVTMFRVNGFIIIAALIFYFICIFIGDKILKLKSPGPEEA